MYLTTINIAMEYDELTHKKRYVYVDWDMSSRCNYKCHYCTPESHDGKVNFPAFDKAITLVDKIDKDFISVKDFAVYNLLGGEPTIWNKLTDFSKHVKLVNNKNILQILTNGNKTLDWWERTSPYLDKILLTVHVSQSNIKELVHKFNSITADVCIDFQIAIDINCFDKCIDDYNYASEHLNNNINLYPKPLLAILSKPELMPYTDDQTHIISNLPHKNGKNLDLLSNPMIKNLNGTTVDNKVDINQLILKKENSWKGWACFIGIDTITINRYGDIKIGSGCNPDLVLGNLDNLNFEFPFIPVKCRYDLCGCVTDICTTKIKNYNSPMIFK
jgi:organic radical activating enzyme